MARAHIKSKKKKKPSKVGGGDIAWMREEMKLALLANMLSATEASRFSFAL